MGYNGPLEKITDFKYRIPKQYHKEMVTDGVVFLNKNLLDQVKSDNALDQVANVATIPGIVGNSMAMPDIHWGYGFPIGGVAAMDVEEGVISPGGVGYDINCGVRLLKTNLTEKDIRKKMPALVDSIFNNVPSGVGSSGKVRVNLSELEDVLRNGASWAVENGYGWKDDLKFLEEEGNFEGADPEFVSERAKKRGLPQLGSLGGGNHFLEIQRVDQIFDPKAAKIYGIDKPGQVMIMIHTGSRGCGYQICDDQIRALSRNFQKDQKEFVSKRFGFRLPDRQLVCAPVDSKEGQEYLKAMKCAANYAWANRQMIVHWIRESFGSVLKRDPDDMDMNIIYDVAHNIAKKEEHMVDGEKRRVMVHRKGATRAFGPDRPEVPFKYREMGQPVLIPGDMGTASYLLRGTEKAMTESFGSTCHGAGRVASRAEAKRRWKPEQIFKELKAKKISIRAASRKLVSEEAPQAYKEIDDVVGVTHGAGISLKVVRLTPLGVVKG